MISPALILSWMWGKKRKPWPEYTSPNSFSKWIAKNNEVLGFQDELLQTFDEKQMKLYSKYRESIMEADRMKPWQNLEELKKRI